MRTVHRLERSIGVQISNSASDVVDVGVREADNGDGMERRLEVFVERKLKSMVGNGALDKRMGQSYGAIRTPHTKPLSA